MKNIQINISKKMLVAAVITLLAVILFWTKDTKADQVGLYFSSTDGSGCGSLSDGDVQSTEHFEGGTVITVSADAELSALYIKWDEIPGTWTLSAGGTTITCGTNGFLHEYVELPAGCTSADIIIPDGGALISDIFGYSGAVPSDVQKWAAPYDRTDILLISAHADDEHLFFGSIPPTYTNGNRARVQVVYFTDFFQTEHYRNHELLDGLWTAGVTHYPQLGSFYDHYSESIEGASGLFDHDASLSFIISAIRRFKPQVLVTHDIVSGEYGHGTHMWIASLVTEAVEITSDAAQYADSASAYGTWDVPKTYLHVYPENQITIPTREPLADFGGRTALEVAQEAYTKHQSQQWMWFYVDDEYEFSCARFGLYRSLVGPDVNCNDVMENLVSYDEQERLAQAAVQESSSEEAVAKTAEKKGGNKVLLIVIGAIGVILVIFIILFIALSAKKAKQKRMEEERRRERARRAERASRARRKRIAMQHEEIKRIRESQRDDWE